MSKRNLKRFLELISSKYGSFFNKKMTSKRSAVRFVISLAAKRPPLVLPRDSPDIIGQRLLYGSGAVVKGYAYCDSCPGRANKSFKLCPHSSIVWSECFILKGFNFHNDGVAVTATRHHYGSKTRETIEFGSHFGFKTQYESNHIVDEVEPISIKNTSEYKAQRNLFKFILFNRACIQFLKLYHRVTNRVGRSRGLYFCGDSPCNGHTMIAEYDGFTVDPYLVWDRFIESEIGTQMPRGLRPLLTEVKKQLTVYAFCGVKKCICDKHKNVTWVIPSNIPGYKNLTVLYCGMADPPPKPTVSITRSYVAPGKARCEDCNLILISNECPRCDSYF
jgi:hypothetical protein